MEEDIKEEIIWKRSKRNSNSFEFKINKNDKNWLHTFEFETEQYFLGIRHILTVECLEYNSINYIGIFIGKNKIRVYKNKIFENYKIGNGTLDVKLSIPKTKILIWWRSKIQFWK